MSRSFASILITGASSGIGAALARRYAAPGIQLALHGRDAARLAEIAALCRAAGAIVETGAHDVTDRAAMAAWIAMIDAAHPLDLVIANAGISGGTSGMGESEEQARRIFAVNLDGVLNTLYPALAPMRARGRGTIALMSSLASFKGLPGGPSYGASKAAVRILGEAMRGDLARHGIHLSTICPGFVTTPMTARNKFTMPFLMDSDRAAAIIAHGLDRNQGRIAFPWPMLALVILLTLLPPGLTEGLINRLPRKRPMGA
jgi:short-subunit dehydrogenase